MSAHAAPLDRGRIDRPAAAVLGRVAPGTWFAVGTAIVLAGICFVAGGGLALDTQVPIEMGLTLGAACLTVGALARRDQQRLDGAASIGLLFGLATFTAASVIWSVSPDASWIEGSRTLAYAFTFVGGVALVRLAPTHHASLLTGVLIATLAVSVYALATRVFPGALSPDEVYARLRDPFGYWNAVGLTAALGVPPCLWLGSRRDIHGAVRALAPAAITLLATTLMLAYSRGALLALGIGCGFYFATVPLRLRSLAVLATGALGAAPVVAWAFAKKALSADHIALSSRIHYGHLLGLLLLGMVLLVYAAGLFVGFAAARWPLSPALRHRAGATVLVCLALVPLAGLVALSASSRGLGGTISHDWRALTDPHATTPPNDPSRLTAVGSVRARYWNDALKIARDNPVVGVGAGGYPVARTRYRADTLEVQHAHGYIVQTLADLGIVGLLTSLAFAGAWCAAAVRTVGRRSLAAAAERAGLQTMIACVIVFTFHSLIDWTWFVPGDAVIALLLGGWVAGRGPSALAATRTHVRLGSRWPMPTPRAAGTAIPAPQSRVFGTSMRGGDTAAGKPGPAGLARPQVRAAGAATVLILALTIAWSQWQPLRAQQAASTAFAALARGDYAGARAAANTAARRDPLSVAPLFDLATIETAAGQPVAARAALVKAVRLTPADATTWEQLASFDLTQLGDRARALRDLGPALYLDPQSHAGISQYLDTLRQPAPGTPAAQAPGSTSGGAQPPASTPQSTPPANPAAQPAGTT